MDKLRAPSFVCGELYGQAPQEGWPFDLCPSLAQSVPASPTPYSPDWPSFFIIKPNWEKPTHWPPAPDSDCLNLQRRTAPLWEFTKGKTPGLWRWLARGALRDTPSAGFPGNQRANLTSHSPLTSNLAPMPWGQDCGWVLPAIRCTWWVSLQDFASDM